MKTYNNHFSIDELTNAICKTQDTAVGPDDVHYQMLKHLPANIQNTLLCILIYFSKQHLAKWKHSNKLAILNNNSGSKTRKRQIRSFQLPSYCTHQLYMQDHGTHGY